MMAANFSINTPFAFGLGYARHHMVACAVCGKVMPQGAPGHLHDASHVQWMRQLQTSNDPHLFDFYVNRTLRTKFLPDAECLWLTEEEALQFVMEGIFPEPAPPEPPAQQPQLVLTVSGGAEGICFTRMSGEIV